MLDTSAAEKFGAISLLNTWMWLAMRTVLCRNTQKSLKILQKSNAAIFYFTQEWIKSNQDRISPYNTDTISSRQGIGIKRK